MSETAVRRTVSRAGPFLQVWLPSFLVFFASGLALFSLNFWITQSSGGALLGVIAGVANIVAVLTVVALSGAIDRTDRRRFVLLVKAVLALALALLAGAYLVGAGAAVLAVAAVAYLLIEATYAVYMAAIETTVADLAPIAWSSRRTASLISLQPQVERTVAPLVGGALMATGMLSLLPLTALAWVALAALCAWRLAGAFAASQSGASTSGARHDPASSGPGGRRDALWLLGTTVEDARVAARWIRRDPTLRFLVVVGVVVNLVVFPFYVLLPAYLGEYAGLSIEAQAGLYGRAATAYGVGMLTSTALLAGLAKRSRRPAEASTACVVALCALLGALSLATDPRLLVPGMGVLGLVFVVLVAVAGAGWLDRTPAEMRARIFSVRRLVVFSSIPLGTSLMGFGGAAIGYFPFLRALLLVVVSLTLAAFAWYMRARPTRPSRAAAP